jgi:hypothetical protein
MASRAELVRNQEPLLQDSQPRLLPRAERGIPCDAAAKAKILDGLRHGQTLFSLLNSDTTLPSLYEIYKARKADPAFADEMQEARDIGAVMRVEEAIDYQGSVRGNKHASIAAEKYVNSAIKVAEKLSPKTMGPLVRHADADGNKLVVNLVSFSIAPEQKPQAIEAEAVEVAQIPAQTADRSTVE